MPWTLVSQERLGDVTSVRVRGVGPRRCLPNGVHAEVCPGPSLQGVFGPDGDVPAPRPVEATYLLSVLWGATNRLSCAALPEAQLSTSGDPAAGLQVVPGPDTLARFAD